MGVFPIFIIFWQITTKGPCPQDRKNGSGYLLLFAQRRHSCHTLDLPSASLHHVISH
jgi:hypothetical protein